VLIVDDDSDALFTIGEYVKQLQCDTIFAHNGMECLLMLNHVNPDLILLDIMMPQMDGFETIRRIRADKRFENIPVIALTAYAMLDNKNVIEKNGFNDLITKPIDFQLLTAKFKKHIKNVTAEYS
ncbi:MAG: response regulator, partial [Bacteroidetes bacterium]|nr:response regulator [Bacteroidota bacterium]